MSRTAVLLRSFAAGEISPLMQGRLELGPYQTGLALCENFVTIAQGPARFRPGARFLQYAKTADSRLIPFVYSDDQAYFVEFSAGGPSGGSIRIHTVAGTLLDPTPAPLVAITNSNPATVKIAAGVFADGDDAYIEATGMPEIGGRWYRLVLVSTDGTNDTFNITTPASGNIDSRDYGTFTAGTATHPIELAHPYADEELAALRYAQSADVLTVTSRTHPVRMLQRTGPGTWQFVVASFGPTISTPSGVPTTTSDIGSGIGYPRDELYAVTKVSIGGTSSGLGESFASPASAARNIDLTSSGAWVKVDAGSPAGAGYRWNFYKQISGLWGYIGQADQTFEDRNVIPDMSIAPPSFGDNEFNADGDYPTTVSYYQQRKVFAGSVNDPQMVWMTRNGTESDTSFTVPARDDNSIAFGIASREMQAIRHLVPLRQLLVFTASAVWKIVPQNNDVLTPSSVSADLIAYAGAATPQPVAVESSVLYAFARGGRIGEIRYTEAASDFAVSDVCLFASHLFDGYAIVDMAMMETPARLLWCVRSDGRLMSLTYQPEHDVTAWHQHDLGGEVRSICVVPNVDNKAMSEDILAAHVRRKFGAHEYSTIELLYGFGDYASEWQETYWSAQANLGQTFSVHVDSALVYEGAPASILIGLHHLEGRTVTVVADGAVLPPLIVSRGRLDIGQPAGRIVVGLPYVGRLKTLPLRLESATAEGQGIIRTVTKAHLRVFHSTGIHVGPDFETMDEMKVRTDEAYGVAPRWRTGQFEVVVGPTWSFGGEVCIEQRDPVPASVVNIALDVEVGG